jgi:lipoprotein-anchoring transpeptidase ErfK/SrfK
MMMQRLGAGFAAAAIAALIATAAPVDAKVLDDIRNAFRDLRSKGFTPGQPGMFKYQRQMVSYPTGEAPGTIIINPEEKFLYYVMGGGKAIRYGVGVGREGFGWHGVVKVGRKAEWPEWRPPPEMIARERERGRIIPDYMPGGRGNPLGARALYLFNKQGDTMYRIHGTSEPWTIGHNVSSGCIRLINNDVIDLYERAAIGAKVIVL